MAVYIDNWKHSQWVPWVTQVTCSCFCCSPSLTTLSLKSLGLLPPLLKELLPFLLPCSSPCRACCSHQRGRLFMIYVLSLLNGLLFLNFQKSNLTWHCTHAYIISSTWGLLRLTPCNHWYKPILPIPSIAYMLITLMLIFCNTNHTLTHWPACVDLRSIQTHCHTKEGRDSIEPQYVLEEESQITSLLYIGKRRVYHYYDVFTHLQLVTYFQIKVWR